MTRLKDTMSNGTPVGILQQSKYYYNKSRKGTLQNSFSNFLKLYVCRQTSVAKFWQVHKLVSLSLERNLLRPQPFLNIRQN